MSLCAVRLTRKQEVSKRTSSSGVLKIILLLNGPNYAFTVDDKTFWWPDENQRGLTRAILNCHPSSIPGMETIRFLYYTK